MDPNSIDVAIQPIYYTWEDTTDYSTSGIGSISSFNKLNAYMDHNCDSFYNSQQRISRFPGLVYAPNSIEKVAAVMGDSDPCTEIGGDCTELDPSFMTYEVLVTSTVPERMRWKLDSKHATNGIKVMLKYASAQARAITVDDVEVPYNNWVITDSSVSNEGEYGPIAGSSCGENRFVATKNVLEFFVTPECEMKIVPRDAILTKVRMQWTNQEFFDNGGTTAFIDRLCASLGIHWSSVKVVGVASGSTIVDYELTSPAEETMSIDQIKAI
jgi:hypothetical protein